MGGGKAAVDMCVGALFNTPHCPCPSINRAGGVGGTANRGVSEKHRFFQPESVVFPVVLGKKDKERKLMQQVSRA